MAKVNFYSIAEPNHLIPLMRFAENFSNRGHDVNFYRGATKIEGDLNSELAQSYPDSPSPYSEDFGDFYSDLLDNSEKNVLEYQSLMQETNPDLNVISSMDYAAAIAAESLNQVWVVIGTNPGLLEPEGSLPYTGRGLTSLGIFNKIFGYFHTKSMNKFHDRVNQLRESVGLKLVDNAFHQQMLQTPSYIALTLKVLEPGNPKFPGQVDFVGPVKIRREENANIDDWLESLLPPIIYVPLNHIPDADNHVFVSRLADGLGEKSCSVLLESRNPNWNIDLPENFKHVESFDIHSSSRKIHLMIHRGNYLAQATAMHTGLPAIIVTAGAESREIASRAEQAGIAITMDMNGLRASRIGQTMTQLLQEPMYRMMAERLKDRLHKRDVARLVVKELEERI
jgi:UDP:flavonoid glycosyltransferase YjiC (YdhE family)